MEADTSLHTACLLGDLDGVKKSISSNHCDLNELGGNGMNPPLMIAAMSGHVEVI